MVCSMNSESRDYLYFFIQMLVPERFVRWCWWVVGIGDAADFGEQHDCKGADSGCVNGNIVDDKNCTVNVAGALIW